MNFCKKKQLYLYLSAKNQTFCRGGGTCLPAGRLEDAKMYFVYVISSSKKNYIYVGLTNDVSRRMDEHNKGYNKTTKPYRPFELKFQEKYSTRSEAREKEKYLKSGSGREFLKSLLKQIAGVAELVDAQDLKSCGNLFPYRFESGPRYKMLTVNN